MLTDHVCSGPYHEPRHAGRRALRISHTALGCRGCTFRIEVGASVSARCTFRRRSVVWLVPFGASPNRVGAVDNASCACRKEHPAVVSPAGAFGDGVGAARWSELCDARRDFVKKIPRRLASHKYYLYLRRIWGAVGMHKKMSGAPEPHQSKNVLCVNISARWSAFCLFW